ncbi:MAG: cytochrome c3 family protein [Magnetococcus sp. DMHC-1]
MRSLRRHTPLLVGMAGLLLLSPWADLQAEYGDVVLNSRSEKGGVRPVVYPHWFHRIRFRCKVCHHELGFKMRVGANDIKMVDIMDGKFCGMCHNDQVAWGLENCHRCHSGLPGLATGIRGGHASTGPGEY